MTRTERYLWDLTDLAKHVWPTAKVVLVEGYTKSGFDDGDIVVLRANSGRVIDTYTLASGYDWWTAKKTLEEVMEPKAWDIRKVSPSLFHTLG